MTRPLDAVRDACRLVASQGAFVRIDAKRLRSYAGDLARVGIPVATTDPKDTFVGPPRDVVAFVLTLDSINFGSGYSPCIRNGGNTSLYFTVAATLKRRFERFGAFTAEQLASLRIHDMADLFNLRMDSDLRDELMQAYTNALNELGRFTLERYQGRLSDLVRDADHSAQRLVGILIQMPHFNDLASYRGAAVPFYKRAQLAAADLSIRLPSEEFGRFDDINDLTTFADNAVPHVLRIDGVLTYTRDLADRIDRKTLLPSGSQEEIEIRACAVHAVEMLLDELRPVQPQLNALMLDSFLWHRAHEPKYRDQPRHLTRTIFY